jgi:hypothetical protein
LLRCDRLLPEIQGDPLKEFFVPVCLHNSEKRRRI